MELSDKFQLKRQTYFLSVYYADTYLNRTPDLKLDSY